MDNLVSTIYRQKINEIQSRIPVRLFQNNQPDTFNKILSEETQKTLEQNQKKNIPSKISGVNVASAPINNKLNTNNFSSLIQSASRKYKVNDSLVSAVIKAESGFNPKALSPAGAMGLMQLMPKTSSGLGVENAFDPEQNIDGGVRYLKQMIDRYNGDEKMALAAYNCGSGTLNRLGINDLNDPAQFSKLPSETRNYIKKITDNMNISYNNSNL